MQKTLTIILLVSAALWGLSSCEGAYMDPGAMGMMGGGGLFGGDHGEDDGDDNKKKSPVYYDKKKGELYFRADKGTNAVTGKAYSSWSTGDGLVLGDFFTGTLATNTSYKIQITGELDVTLAKLSVLLSQDSGNKKDWVDVTDWIDGENVSSGTVDKTFTVKTIQGININPPVWILFVNNVNAGNVSDGKVMATIKNFNMTITKGN